MAKEPRNANPDANQFDSISLNEEGALDILPESALRSSVEMQEEATRSGLDINLGGKRMGGPTGGDLSSGGGPAIGAVHAADDATAEHFGSREETNAALEDKIALQNTIRLNDRF